MGHLEVKASECEYKVRDRRLKEPLINRISDDDMLAELIKEQKQTTEITSDQRPQKHYLTLIKKVEHLTWKKGKPKL